MGKNKMRIIDLKLVLILSLITEFGNSLNIDSEDILVHDISILDLQGRIVKTLPASNIVDVSQLTSGLYFLKIPVEGVVISKKFIKM